MKTIQVRVGIYEQEPDPDNISVVPVQIPELGDVRRLARQLHAEGTEYHGTAWDWPIHYEPELDERDAHFDVPDGHGTYHTQIRDHWSPAIFSIGESFVWFFSLLWENGKDAEPTEYLDDENVISNQSSSLHVN